MSSCQLTLVLASSGSGGFEGGATSGEETRGMSGGNRGCRAVGWAWLPGLSAARHRTCLTSRCPLMGRRVPAPWTAPLTAACLFSGPVLFLQEFQLTEQTSWRAGGGASEPGCSLSGAPPPPFLPANFLDKRSGGGAGLPPHSWTCGWGQASGLAPSLVLSPWGRPGVALTFDRLSALEEEHSSSFTSRPGRSSGPLTSDPAHPPVSRC